jgi:hypothetical protein
MMGVTVDDFMFRAPHEALTIDKLRVCAGAMVAYSKLRVVFANWRRIPPEYDRKELTASLVSEAYTEIGPSFCFSLGNPQVGNQKYH